MRQPRPAARPTFRHRAGRRRCATDPATPHTSCVASAENGPTPWPHCRGVRVIFTCLHAEVKRVPPTRCLLPRPETLLTIAMRTSRVSPVLARGDAGPTMPRPRGGCRMKAVWAFAVAGLLVLAVDAHADTVFLKDGQSVWGREITEEGDMVTVVRPGETLRFPKREVDRIDRWRLSVPKYYEPPAATPGASDEKPASV